ncbi:MAG: hypothetical protein ACRC7Q_14140 [Plesiomonas shigelloides]
MKAYQGMWVSSLWLSAATQIQPAAKVKTNHSFLHALLRFKQKPAGQ